MNDNQHARKNGNIVNCSTLLREVETRVAGLMEDNRNLYDITLQFRWHPRRTARNASHALSQRLISNRHAGNL